MPFLDRMHTNASRSGFIIIIIFFNHLHLMFFELQCIHTLLLVVFNET